MTDTLAEPESIDALREVERLQAQIAALNELATAVRSGEPLENALSQVAAKAAAMVGGVHALISLINSEGVLQLAIPSEQSTRERVVFPSDSNAYQIVRNALPVIVHDISSIELSEFERTLAKEWDVTGFLAVPLRVFERVVGLLHIIQRIDGLPYDSGDLSRVETFASQAAIAIDNARLYSETRSMASRLRVLVDAATETASSLEIDEILLRVCERARDMCDADTAAISLLDESGTRLLTTTLAGYDPAAEVRARSVGPIPLSRNALAREAFAMGGAVHSRDNINDSRALARGQDDSVTTKSVSAIPLLFRSEHIGILFIGWTQRSHELEARERDLIETLAQQASVAIQNARLFGAITQRTEQFKALVDHSIRAASETDVELVIRATTEAAAKLLAADRASLRLYDERTNLLIPHWKVGYSAEITTENLVRRPGQGTPGRAFAERRPIIENRYSDPEIADGRPEHVGLQSSLSVPLSARGRPLGVLNVGSLHARQFDDEDSELLQLFANQAALAIENARLLQREIDQAGRLEGLYENAHMLTTSLDLSVVLDALIKAAAQMTSATFCACFLVDEDMDDIYYAAGLGKHPELWQGLRLHSGDGLVGIAILEDRPVLVPDLRKDRRSIRSDLDEAEGLGTVIYTPLRARGQVIGALGAGKPDPNGFSDEDFRLLSAFADHAASAIANAHLHDRTEENLRHLTALRSVIESISSELDLNALLDKLVIHAVGLMDASGGTVSLIDPVSGRGRLKAVHGLSRDLIDREIPPGTGMVGSVIQSRQVVVISQYSTLPQPFPDRSLLDLHAGLAVPIWRQDALVGVFSVFTRDPNRRFGPADIETLTTFAKHAAIAIENARLYEQSQQLAVTEERNRLAREIHDTLAQGMTGILLQLELADMLIENQPEARQHVRKAIELARENLEEARRSVLDLRAEALEGQTLSQALEQLLRNMARETGMTVEFTGPPTVERFPARVESGLYRIAQEALTNIRKHAQARTVHVGLVAEDDHLRMTIQDDGMGFAPDERESGSERPDGFGLPGMSERAALLGGSLGIVSYPSEGTRVQVSIPMTGLGLRLRR